MRQVAFVFFLAAVLCLALGMCLGFWMAASGNYVMAGAHAHLNLVGWASLALFGIYYHVTPQAALGWLPRVHAAVAIAGTAVMVSGITLEALGGSSAIAFAGSLLVFASMLILVFTVLRHGLGSHVGDHRHSRLVAPGEPAE